MRRRPETPQFALHDRLCLEKRSICYEGNVLIRIVRRAIGLNGCAWPVSTPAPDR